MKKYVTQRFGLVLLVLRCWCVCRGTTHVTHGCVGLAQLHAVTRERDALAQKLKVKEEAIQGMETTISVAKEEVSDVKQVAAWCLVFRTCDLVLVLTVALGRRRHCNWSACKSKMRRCKASSKKL